MKSLLLLSLASAATATPSVHIPLIRRSHTGIFSPDDLAAQRDALDAKYHTNGAITIRPRQNEGGVPMVNQNGDLSYYAFMNVGTPPTAYGVALDTGSSDLWFQSEACVGCDGAKISTTSSSLQQTGRPFSIRYGSGAVQGTIVSDHVEMGGFAVDSQVMGLVTQASGVLLNGRSAGLLGLAFQRLSNTESVPFWEALVTSGRWSQPLMSFWMTRFGNISTVRVEEYGGEFRMGGLNASLYTGEVEYIDMPSSVQAYWSIPLRQITVNGGPPITITNLGVTSLAAIDTGTSLIGGPPDIVAEIYSQVPNARKGTGNLERYWVFPCNQVVSITLNFGGRTWPIEPTDLILATTNPSVCVGAIFEVSMGGLGNPDVPQWIVGDAFLKNVYSVFRYQPPSVGFAQLSAAAGGALLQQPIPTTAPTPTAVRNISSTSVVAPTFSTSGPSPNGGISTMGMNTAINEIEAHAVPRPRKAVSVSSASLIRRGKSHPTLNFAAERKGLQEKYGGKYGSTSYSTRSNIIQEDMVNQNMDVMYYASVEVGTPPQSYAVILDTGSSDMWLQSVACAPCTGKKIDPATSSTLQPSSSSFSIAYGIGSVRGSLVNDVVSIGSSPAFTVQNQIWGLVNYTLGTPVPGNIAGLMGLGFKNLAASQATPFWETLVSNNQWDEPVMSFWMTRYGNISSASDAEFGGEFILGGTNEALYTGDIEFVSLPYASNPTFWAIPIHSITVNGNEISTVASDTSAALAAIDTATSLIGGPPSAVRKLYAAIPGAKQAEGVLEGFWTLPSMFTARRANRPQSTLNFGGRAWAMSSDDFVLTTSTPNTCVGAVFETSLGDPDNAQIPQ
ncbi:peptidase A1 family, partial [Rhizoctonia solani]